MNATGLTLVGASAGSGKTHRLTEEVMRALGRGGLPVEALFAVTYTRKAHAELAARIRRALVAAGAFAEAARLPLAVIGTVHGACLRLLEELALDAGLPPRVEPIGGDPQRLLRESIEPALAPALAEEMQQLARRLGVHYDARTRRADWLRPVGDIMELARSNRLAPDGLPAMAERSWAALRELLPPPGDDGLDEALARALAHVEPRLDALAGTTKIARDAADAVRRRRAALAHGELTWADWLALSKLDGGKGARDLLRPLQWAAAAHERHPAFHADLERFTAGVFEAARVGLEAYADWKQRQGLVDYTDMLDRALTLLDDEGVAAELAGRLGLVVVDELQDTSPLQLALFTRLHRLAGRSLWVGDRKQCIFEYAGADPALMEAVTGWVERSGGVSERLGRNHRSRPELVAFTSDRFARAFAVHGMSAGEVVVEPQRERGPQVAPLGLWWLAADTNEEQAAALAAGIARLLADPAATPVVDRHGGGERPLEPRDVCLLVATNAEAGAVAAALHGHGVHVAVARPGLMATPEGTLVTAALHYLLDGSDRLAGALLDALGGWNGDPDRWLAEQLDALPPSPPHPWRVALDAARPALRALSPVEAVDRALVALDVTRACARWPDPAQRLANLDALRGMAAAYQERARRRGEAASVAGLLAYFAEARQPVRVRDEELATDDQHVRHDGDAVTVSTYHRAKGLEWPVVILGSLGRAERRTAFDVAPESDRAGFDPDDPLGGRWIRYWPRPYPGNAPLIERAEASAEGQRVALRERRERLRLLYVGFTRARDHLVLALREGGKHHWLDELVDGDGQHLVPLPEAVEGDVALAGVTTRAWRLAPVAPAARAATPAIGFARPDQVVAPAPHWIAPSRAVTEWTALPAAGVGEVARLDAQLAFARVTGVAWDSAGTAVHGFFACDLDGLPPEERLARATRLVAASELDGLVRPADLLRSADALRAFVAARWPGARWRREVPITAFAGEPRRRIEGTIDLLLETAAGDVVIDHKSFPDPRETAWRVKAAALAPQLVAYAEALRLLGRTVVGTWFHLPVAGAMVEIVRDTSPPP